MGFGHDIKPISYYLVVVKDKDINGNLASLDKKVQDITVIWLVRTRLNWLISVTRGYYYQNGWEWGCDYFTFF